MKYKIKNNIWVVFVAFTIISCSKMNDMHQMYLDDGEKIYAAKVDSVAAHSGHNRIELEIFIFSQRINNLRIYWNNSNDSSDIEISNQTGVFKTIVSDLEEGDIIFDLVSFDNYGNKSLNYEVIGYTYGDIYLNSLTNRTIETMGLSEEGEGLVITWRGIGNSIRTVFSYQNTEGGLSRDTILPNESEIILTDYLPGGEYWYVTQYKPTETSIDIFETSEFRGFFPNFSNDEVDD